MTLTSDQQADGSQAYNNIDSSHSSPHNKQSNPHSSSTAIRTHNEGDNDANAEAGTGEAENEVGEGDEDSLEDKGEEDTLLLTDTDFLDILQQVENTDIHTLKQLIANME